MHSIQNLNDMLSLDDTNETIIKIDEAISKICLYGEKVEDLTEPQRNFFFNQIFEKEINNGGFSQYFFNSSGDFANNTVNSLKKIGAKKTADILQRALNEFPSKHAPENRAERINLLNKIENKAISSWELLEEEFYNYEDDLNSLNLRYVIENKGAF